ncbi:positive regulation of fibroblast apoptotic process [Sparganum proliferum]
MDYAKRSRSVTAVTESWRAFYRTEGETIGRGGTGKVFRVRPTGDNSHPYDISNCRKASESTVSSNGTFGEVFEVINPIVPGKFLAVKLIRRFRSGRDSIEKIRKEIALMKKLQSSHNNITGENVPASACPLLISVHEDLTEVAIVMEFAKGGSLFDLCCERYSAHHGCSLGDSSPRGAVSKPPMPPSRRRSSVVVDARVTHAPCPLPERYIASVIEKISSALMYMHETAKIVHLDIKAENILLREPFPSSDVFITDFGLASVLTDTKPHRELAGTPDYTAPEVISYDPVSFATDMWSVGVLAYFLLTGVSPFLADSKALTLSNITQMKIDYPDHLFAHTSPEAVHFIQALIKRRPRDRLSAAQCRQHVWIQSNLVDSAITPKSVSLQSVVESNSEEPPEAQVTTAVAAVDEPMPQQATPNTAPPLTIALPVVRQSQVCQRVEAVLTSCLRGSVTTGISQQGVEHQLRLTTERDFSNSKRKLTKSGNGGSDARLRLLGRRGASESRVLTSTLTEVEEEEAERRNTPPDRRPRLLFDYPLTGLDLFLRSVLYCGLQKAPHSPVVFPATAGAAVSSCEDFAPHSSFLRYSPLTSTAFLDLAAPRLKLEILPRAADAANQLLPKESLPREEAPVPQV